MAESIVFDIAGEIIRKLSSPALREVALWWGVQAEIEKLKNTVSTIRAVLLDAEKKQGQSEQVKDWLGKLKYIIYDAEDLLDDFSTEALQRQAMDGSRLTKEVRLFFSRSNQFAYGLKMGHKIKSLRERLAGINADRQFLLDEHLPDQDEATTRTRSGRETDSVVPEVVIGREDEQKAIIGLLLDSGNFGVSVPVVSIVGIGGLGKTTLAQFVLDDDCIQSHFELKLWVCVSDNFDTKTVVRKILESATKTIPAEVERNTLIVKLQEIINGKRFLLVLDDVWDDNRERWADLKKLLRCGGGGSRVLVTTRQAKVARMASEAVPPCFLRGLSEEESWSLLAKMAFDDGQESRKSSLEMIGREIVKKCAGVPLAIKTIGKVLYFKDTREEWLSFKDKELANLKQDEGDIMPTLKLSYDHLPSHLKHCFVHCSLFPKDYRIPVETLIQLWIAQGFVTRSLGARECLEDIGLECFKDLLWRSFFQEVEYDKWGNIERCKMHDLMHDLAISVGKGESCLVLEDGGVDTRGNFRHVSFGFNLISLEQIPTEFSTKAKCLRTFLLPCQRSVRHRVESKVCEAILHDFRGLRALELHMSGPEKLPASWGMKLKHLRYLDLSWNDDIRVLPDSITKLQNLQVLKLSGCRSLSELPKDIRKLKNLQCLDCWACDALSHMPRGLGELVYLWRLRVFVVGEGSGSSGASKHKYESGGLEELHGLNNLKGSLEIKNLGNVRNGEREFEAAYLEGKNLLQSLDLDWGREVVYNWAVVDVDYEERCFQKLQPHPNLKGLLVDGYGGVRFPSWFSSLENLVKISIKNCGRCKCLPPFHQFPSLQELEIWGLDELEYMVAEDNDGEINNAESSSSSSTLFFPSLKSLSLKFCLKLKGWWKNQGGKYGDDDDGNNSASAATVLLKLPHFHRLSKLSIWSCPNLTQMPLFPSVTDELQFEGSRLEPLRQTMEMKRSSTLATSSSSSSGTPVMHPPSPPPLSELKELLFWRIRSLESLPEEWLQNLTSLQKLQIWDCPNLKSLPQGMKHHLTSLRRIEIRSCPQLEKRCGNKRGADWPIISHIPNIDIDLEDIQRDGRYLLDG